MKRLLCIVILPSLSISNGNDNIHSVDEQANLIADSPPIIAGFLPYAKKEKLFRASHVESGSDLLSRAVSSQVPSALRGLTSVFGMGTGVTLSS